MCIRDRVGGGGRDGGEQRDRGERGGQRPAVGEEADGGRAEQHAAVAEGGGGRDAARPGQFAGPPDGDREDVGEADAGDGEAEEYQPGGGRERSDQHAERGRGASGDQRPGLAEPFEERGAGQPPERHGGGEDGVAGGREAGPGVQVLLEVECAPVGERPLSVRRAQGDEPEDGDQAARPAREPRGGGGGRRSRGNGGGRLTDRRGMRQQNAPGGRREHQSHHGQHQQMAGRGQLPGDQPAQPGAEHPAEAERRVEAGHDGPAQGRDEVDGRRVHRDVDAAVGRAEDEQDEAEGERGVRQRRQRDAEREQDSGGDGDRVGPEAVAEPAGHHHGGDRSGGHTEQGQSEIARGGAGLLLDRGDADHPAGEDEAVEGEEYGEGGTEAA